MATCMVGMDTDTHSPRQPGSQCVCVCGNRKGEGKRAQEMREEVSDIREGHTQSQHYTFHTLTLHTLHTLPQKDSDTHRSTDA